MGESKYRQTGRTYAFAEHHSLERGELQRHAEWVRAEGVVCYLGWETPF